jgi:cellulose synthase/poly-beta-1,6-N-acetylglucosamine synthase-like glycosyltransferase
VRESVVAVLAVVDAVVLLYFLAINSLYLLFSVIAFFRLRQHRHRWTPHALDAVLRSPATPGISVVVPAYNEEATIAESVRGMLLLNYPQFEVIVVNDGSRDRTLAVLVEAFHLLPAPVAYDEPLPTAAVRGLYRSLEHPELVVIDKENGGGKADAMNAGLNAAHLPLVCIVDADSILEEHALTRAVLPFLEDPKTIAAGGIIRIANGCRVESGRVTEVALPRSALATFQVVEYLRAFLAGRVAHSAMNALLIISGAFGVFRREVVLAARGFRSDTIGEDMELVTRLHRIYRDAKKPYRIVFQPDPVCWTEAPEQTRILANQRDRWQRGTWQVMSYHCPGMIGRPRYGPVGLLAMPYYLIFETLGPLVEVSGYVFTLLAVVFGLLDVRFAQLLFLTAVVYGTMISLAAVLLEEISYRRYPRLLDLLKLAAFGVFENFGYRQLTAWWRLRGTIAFFRKQQGWGQMTRKGFQRA